jgi:hypothetical protein
MDKLVSNLLFVLMFWAQLFVVAHEFLGLTWACAAMLPFTFLGWAWCTPPDKKDASASTETIGTECVTLVREESPDAPPPGSPENN